MKQHGDPQEPRALPLSRLMRPVAFIRHLAKAAAAKLSALLTKDSLERRAKRGSRERFEEALAQLPDVEPEEYDRL